MVQKNGQVGLLLLVGLLMIPQANAEEPDLLTRHLIGERVAEYAYRWDAKNAVEFANLFAPDAVFDWVVGGVPEKQKLQGRKNIETYAAKAHQERLANRQSRHHFSNLVFKEQSSQRALTEHMFLVTHQLPGEALKVMSAGKYRIRWVYQDDQWLIKHRTLFVDR